jgi:hypothetical protein
VKFSEPPTAGVVPHRAHRPIKLDVHICDGYAGSYRRTLGSGSGGPDTVRITREGNGLMLQTFNRERPQSFPEEFFPESETAFFNTTEDMELTFVRNSRQALTGLRLYQNGTFGQFGRREFKKEL